MKMTLHPTHFICSTHNATVLSLEHMLSIVWRHMETTFERQVQPSMVFDNSITPLHVAHRLLQSACLSKSGVVTEFHITAHTVTFTHNTDMLQKCFLSVM